MGYREVIATYSLHQGKSPMNGPTSPCNMMKSRRCWFYLSILTSAVYVLQALVHSRAINNALEQLLALPDPSALKPRLTSFLEALLQEHSARPGKLACASVELAAFAVQDKSQASNLYA